MGGFRGFLVGVANLLLVLLVLVPPTVAFLAGGWAFPSWAGGGFNTQAGLLSALVALVVGLPSAAFLAVFLDIREQLVQLNATRALPAERAASKERAAERHEWARDVPRDARGLTDLSRY